MTRRGSAGSAKTRQNRFVSVRTAGRSEEHTSEPSHTVISYAVFCLKKKTKTHVDTPQPARAAPTPRATAPNLLRVRAPHGKTVARHKPDFRRPIRGR